MKKKQIMHLVFSTRRLLSTTTAITSAAISLAFISAGAIVGSSTFATAQETTQIPLEYIYQDKSVGRLGIWVGVNDGKARRYMFDTGSDQFNAAVGKEVNATDGPGKPLKYYAYGDSTYGYAIQQADFNKLSYFGKNDPTSPIKVLKGQFQVANIIDDLFTKDSGYIRGAPLSPEAVCVASSDTDDKKCYKPGELDKNNIKKEYHADLDARKKIGAGLPFEEGDTFSGTFGAGDFLGTDSLQSSALPGMTKSGFVVAANSENANGEDGTNPATPGCSPCVIVDLNPSLRAQFTSVMPWGDQSREGWVEKFPGEQQGNASTLFEGAYALKIGVGTDDEKLVAKDIPVLLDTGTPDGGTLKLGNAKFDELLKANVIKKQQKQSPDDPDAYEMDLSISAPGGSDVFLSNVSVEKSDDNTIEFTAGLDFFRSQSVVFDLEKKTTAYTPYFVSADNFTTDAGGLNLSRITRRMGNQDLRYKFDDNGKPVLGKDGNPVQETIGMLGIAGVVSGTGALTLDSYTDVRMTNVNTYSGATYIGQDALLFLAGLGSIERSAKVVADGTLDISERGNANDYWGISDAYNDARIRSLSGGSAGSVQLGNQTLILTAANDVFAGGITDLAEDKKHRGGGLVVAGGVQTLSGKNDYTGMTTVGQGAGLLLAETGSITHDVTTSGLLGNDGQIGGIALANKDGVIVGAGSFGAVTIADGGKVAPGSAFDPGRPIAALTVDGDFVQQAGSTYEADFAMPGDTSDLINVTGRATIESGAAVEIVRQGEGKLSVGARYTLLTAAQGVSGTYNSLTGTLVTDSPFVDFDLTYDPTKVYLGVDRTATAFADVGKTFNQRSAAAASEALGSGNAVYDNILFLTEGGSRTAFDLLSGEVHASVHSALIEDGHFVRDAASDRIRAAFDGVGASPVPVMSYGPGGPEIAPADGDRLAVWGRGFGAWGHLDGDGNAARLDRSTGGFLAGADTLVGQDWRLGLLAGYSHTSFEVDDRLSSGSSENYHLGAYAGTQWGKLGFRSGLAYTWHRLDTDRSVAFPGFSDSLSSDHDAGAFQAFGELGYRVETPMAAFEPYGNLAYVHLKTDGFREKGGAAALSSSGQSSDTTFTTLGLRASADFQLGAVPATARGGIGWRHAFGDVTPEATLAFAGGDAFAVRGTPIAKDAALVEAGLDVNVTRNASLGLAYQGQIASSAQEHGFNAELDVRF